MSSSSNLRIRLKFESTSISHSQKCWFTFDSEKCKLVSDIRHLIASRFSLKKPNGIQFYMDDFLVPINESAKIIRDNDTILIKTPSISQEDSSSSSEESSSDSSEDSLQPKSKQAKIIGPNNQVFKSKQAAAVTKSTEQRKTVVKPVIRVNPKATITQTKSQAQAKSGASTAVKKTVAKQTTAKASGATKRLVETTTKSLTGALHTKFQSSSSSSSSDTSSNSSSTSSDDEDTRKRKVSQKIKANGKGAGILKGGSQWDKKASSSTRDNVAKSSARGGVSMRGRGLGRGVNSTRGRNRHWNSSPNVIVGGADDVLTTRSAFYTRGRGRINKDKTTRENHMQIVNDVQQSLQQELASNDTGHLPEPIVEVPPIPDYSTCPSLNGPPRQGDNLAFKILEMSSTYTPEVSQYKDGKVMEYDSATKMMKIKYSESYMRRLTAEPKEDVGKFSLPDEDQEDTNISQEVKSVIEVSLDELIETRLLGTSPADSKED